MSNSRREVLIGIAGVAAAAEAGGQHNHQHSQSEAAGGPAGAYKPKAFSAGELRTVGALAETIIPKTQTAGALEAKVHEIIDETLAGKVSAIAAWRKGLKEVDALARKMHRKAYADLNDDQQAAAMTELAAKSKFFETLKNATVDAYYSTKEGLQAELGWQGAVPLPEFKGCTHKEHQS
jgi:hypothetical protein